MSNYNLDLLKDPSNRAIITRWINGKGNQKKVEELFDQITGRVSEPKKAEMKVVKSDYPSEEQYQNAISGKKQDLVDFAEKYSIDISDCTNNEQRIKAITKWFNTSKG